MNFLHSNYYFPTHLKLRKLKTRQKTRSMFSATPEPLTIKRLEGFGNGARPSTTGRVNKQNVRARTPLKANDQYADNFDYYIENFAVTHFPPNEVINHFNTSQKLKSKLYRFEGLQKPSTVVYNNTFLPDDFSVLDFPRLENELFFTGTKKKISKPIKTLRPSSKDFEVVGNPLSLNKKLLIKVRKVKKKGKVSGIQLKFPKVDLNTSISFKSTLI